MKVSSKDKLYGLLLTGGKSSRMGIDKASIEYHGIPQADYLMSLLKNVCDAVYLSVQKEQDNKALPGSKYIVDKNHYLGPFNGLYSAHLEYPEVAWLVLACDLPFMDIVALRNLINNRNKEKLITAYCKKSTGIPEPLCAIWESNSFQKAESFFTRGEGVSPSKFFKTIDIECVYPKNDQVLMNVNTLEEFRLVKKKIDSKNNMGS